MADLPCPTCGSSLTFLEQYHRLYCHHCGQYAPEGYGERGAKRCPTCGGILSYVAQYDRLYCYRCNAYPAESAVPQPKAEIPSPAATSAPAETPATPAVVTEPPSIAPPSETPSIVAVTPVAVLPAPQPPPQPSPDNAAPAVAPVAADVPTSEPATPMAATPAPLPAEPKPAEPAPAEPSREMQTLAAAKPAAIRVKLFALKKTDLVDLCTIYKLDPSGTKEELQQRLLTYLHRLETEEEPKPEPEERVPEEPAVAVDHPAETVEAHAIPAVIEAPAVEEAEPAQVVAAQPATVLVAPAPVVVEAPRATPKVGNPCPTCGRELTFISQYNRHYCYYCQRYAPAAGRSKNACPTCGATMRWIDQHQRWWCDSCQKYASADLPAPSGAVATIAATAPATAASPARAIVVHHHGSPAGGAGLVGLGIALYIVYAFFAYLGDLLGVAIPAGITPEILNLLQFFAFLLVALGAIAGLYGLRDRT